MNHRPWLKNYDPLLPHTLEPYPDCTLLDKLAETVQQRPDHVMIIFKGLHISASQVEALSNDFAAALLDLGLTRGERVAALLPNSPQAGDHPARSVEARGDLLPHQSYLYRMGA